MSKPPAVNEWDQLETKIGRLTLAAGYLEMAIITMVCRILGKSEDEIDIRSNEKWCQTLADIAPPSWSDAQKKDLSKRLKEIRKLYLRRNRLIHAALVTAGDNSISGVPAGSIIDLRTYGIGFSKRKGNTWTIGVVGKRLHLREIDKLVEELNKARIGLMPHVDLVAKIKRPPRPFPMPKLGKLLSD